MSFTILTIIFTIFAGIAVSLLAHHYSVYALLPATFFVLALAAAGCVVYGANFSASALAALSGVIGLQFGYLLRIFVPRSGGRSGAMSCDSKRALCANDDETSHPGSLPLRGEGRNIPWSCPLSTSKRLLPEAPKQREAVGRLSFQRLRRPRPNSRTGRAVAPSRPPTSCGYCARSTRRERAASARSCGGRGSTPRC